MTVNLYEVSQQYVLAQEDYLLFPKINIIYQDKYCNLALWSTSEETSGPDYSEKFAIGQTFIRRYGIVYSFS